jgi:hypothetical protein
VYLLCSASCCWVLTNLHYPKLLAGAQRQARGGCIAGLKLVKTATAACSSGGVALAAADPAAAAATAGAAQDEEAAAAELEAVVTASQQQQQAGADMAAGEGRLYLYTFEQQAQYQSINCRKARQQPQQQQDEGTAAEGGGVHSGQQAPQEEQQQQQQSVDAAAAGGNDSSNSKASRQRLDREQTVQGISASPGEMLLLSADGMQVGAAVLCVSSDVCLTAAGGADFPLVCCTATQLPRLKQQAE